MPNVKGRDTTGRICFSYWFLGFYTKLFPSQEALEIESNLKTVKSLYAFISVCSFMHKHNWLSLNRQMRALVIHGELDFNTHDLSLPRAWYYARA